MAPGAGHSLSVEVMYVTLLLLPSAPAPALPLPDTPQMPTLVDSGHQQTAHVRFYQ